jgi:hypothetical protein
VRHAHSPPEVHLLQFLFLVIRQEVIMSAEDKARDAHVESLGMCDATGTTEKHGDVALSLFSNVRDANEEIDPHAERRLVRKIDWMINPFICVTYLVTYIDKATLGYAAVFNLQTDLHLHGTEYSWLGSLFYFGYLVVCGHSPLALEGTSRL